MQWTQQLYVKRVGGQRRKTRLNIFCLYIATMLVCVQNITDSHAQINIEQPILYYAINLQIETITKLAQL